ncbi:FKBP-type peptidyl-prolyl cis-trans isomerase [Compostimonas suwonensis]|uniref:peptidylprolyl isomerase n=1 Tax=Compostimonas suwonensis TaxID=1048394 RepID=A0A2M9BYU1_9MICO|nr:FKBP-type peptidyl-prolyl cis-trans isomerase [Compostimonas suwonensis]PJJ63247.1 peptidylprolyl isomerase [Compostimonas suwonensis]
MRKTSALIVTAGLLAVALSACSPSSGSTGDCTPEASSGATSDAVTVSGSLGSNPTVDFPTPLKTKTTEVTEVIPGSGDVVKSGQKVATEMTVFNGTTGESIQDTGAAAFVLGQTITGITDGLVCSTTGSRVVVAVPPEDGFGTEGNAQLGISGTDTLVFVFDVTKSYLSRADGADQPAQAGFPSVVTAPETGQPGITIPAGDAPTELKVAVLKKGGGEPVVEGDSVTVHYTGVIWDSKTVFDSSWESGSPATFLAADGSKVQGGVIPGFANALIGQTVGSQIIAIIPPDQAYGEAGNQSVPANATLVFVVDILGVDPAPAAPQQ